jgi:hypothetical protein
MGKPCVSWRAKAMSPLMVFSDPDEGIGRVREQLGAGFEGAQERLLLRIGHA